MMWIIESSQERAIRLLADRNDFETRAQFNYSWSWWPRKCYVSDRRVWGRAVVGHALWTGPGEPIVERRWLHRDEAVIMMLKRKTS